MKRILLVLGIAGFTMFANAQVLPGIDFPGTTKKSKDEIKLPVPIDPTAVDPDTERKSLPPGLAKKRDGAKSAKDYAPGQLKKRNRSYNDNNGSIFGNGDNDDKKHGKHSKAKKHKKDKIKDRQDDDLQLGGIFGQEQNDGKGKGKHKNKDREDDDDD